MFCPNCGKECQDMKFCPECGQKLTDGAVSILNTKPEPGTEEFEAKRAELTRQQIPHCPECLSVHISVLVRGAYSHPYDTRFICRWCGHEWHPKMERKFKEPNWN